MNLNSCLIHDINLFAYCPYLTCNCHSPRCIVASHTVSSSLTTCIHDIVLSHHPSVSRNNQLLRCMASSQHTVDSWENTIQCCKRHLLHYMSSVQVLLLAISCYVFITGKDGTAVGE